MKATCQHVEHFRFVSRERRRGHSHTRREEEEVLPVNLRRVTANRTALQHQKR